MVAADVVAVTHLLIANVLYFVGEYTRVFQSWGSLRPGRDIVYRYLDMPVYFLLDKFFNFMINFLGSLPLIGFTGSWFGWFFIDTDDTGFRIMHAEFVIVCGSLFYGLIAYLMGKIFLKVFGLDED